MTFSYLKIYIMYTIILLELSFFVHIVNIQLYNLNNS